MIRDFDGVNGLSRAYDIGYNDGFQQGRAEMQEFVEKRCKELGIDYTLIFTCEGAD